MSPLISQSEDFPGGKPVRIHSQNAWAGKKADKTDTNLGPVLEERAHETDKVNVSTNLMRLRRLVNGSNVLLQKSLACKVSIPLDGGVSLVGLSCCTDAGQRACWTYEIHCSNAYCALTKFFALINGS